MVYIYITSAPCTRDIIIDIIICNIFLHSPSGAAHPQAFVYISDKALMPVLQLLHLCTH